jgi:hypothetical protein
MKAIIASIALATIAYAQQTQTEAKDPVILEDSVVGVAGPKDVIKLERHAVGGGFGVAPHSVEFISTEANIAGKVVKNAPYSAEAVTETTQTLSDGNRITNKTSAATYRDSEGRTRRDMTMPAIGPWAASGDAPVMIWIHDPVAGVNYHLDSKTKTARKMPGGGAGMISFGPIGAAEMGGGDAIRMRSKMESGHRAGVPAMGGAMIGIHQTSGPAGAIVHRQGRAPKTESLGQQAIDGILAEGTRSTITIPAGEMGNERDINIVNERWYSTELQTVIMSKHSDPRMGETVYRLDNIKRGDPHPSLFEVPSDYTVATVEAPFTKAIKKIDRDE